MPERPSRDQLAVILGAAAEGITVQDSAGKLVYANDAAAHLSGYPNAEAMLAARPLDIVGQFRLLDEHGAPFPVELLPGRLVLHGQAAAEAVVRFRNLHTGAERWALLNATPISDGDGRVQLAVNVFRDITERKRAEDTARFLAAASSALAESLDYRATLQRVADLAVPALADWCLVDIAEDRGIERVAFAHADPAKIAITTELQRVYPDDPTAPRGVPNVIRTGRSEMVSEIDEQMLEMAARDRRHLELVRQLQLRSYIIVPLIARGRTLGALSIVGSTARRAYDANDLAVAEDLAARAALAVDNARLYRDAREQAEAHALLNRALRETIGERDEAAARLQETLHTRDEFLAAAAHDLKGPLSSIKMGAQMLRRRAERDTPLDVPGLREALTRIDNTATRAAAQVDELLDLARLQMGGTLDLDRLPLDLVDLARSVIAEHELRTERHQLRLVTTEDALVGDWDERRVRRVVGNLVDNAIKYSPSGGLVELDVWREMDAESAWAVLAVRDRGVGIPSAELERVFERFTRAANVVGRISGTGLGLSSARHIMEVHGGTLQVESIEGEGSTFTIRLPLEPSGASSMLGSGAAPRGDRS